MFPSTRHRSTSSWRKIQTLQYRLRNLGGTQCVAHCRMVRLGVSPTSHTGAGVSLFVMLFVQSSCNLGHASIEVGKRGTVVVGSDITHEHTHKHINTHKHTQQHTTPADSRRAYIPEQCGPSEYRIGQQSDSATASGDWHWVSTLSLKEDNARDAMRTCQTTKECTSSLATLQRERNPTTT